jgi:hypothetical protein
LTATAIEVYGYYTHKNGYKTLLWSNPNPNAEAHSPGKRYRFVKKSHGARRAVKAKTGRSLPTDKDGGWRFPTEWPVLEAMESC